MPVSDRRVFTGCFDSCRADLRHRPVEVDLHHLAAEDVVGRLGQVLRRVGLQLLEEHALRRDLRLDLAVGRAGHADADRQRGAVARQADHPHVVAEILAAELRADAEVLRQLVAPSAPARGRGWRGRTCCPSVGSVSSQRVEASFTVLRVISAEVPPITMAR